jgi:hypothetical protein
LQGNVKLGTYGYVDETGEVKRVSYSTKNSTLFKEHQPVVQINDEDNETISPASSQRYNRSFIASTTRRPSSLAYLTSSPLSPTNKPSVVQSIPSKRQRINLQTAQKIQTDIVNQPFEGTTTVVYATSVPTPKPYSSRSTTSPTYSSRKAASSQLISSTTEKGVEIDQVERKVFISTSKDSTTAKPKVDKNDEKLDLIKRGNSLRRQILKPAAAADIEEGIEAQSQILYGDGDESSAVYGGNYGNVRPLFTTTSQPKIPLQVLAARQRATQLHNILANSSPGTTPTTTTERISVKPSSKAYRQSKVKVEEATEEIQAPEQIPATEQTENDERRAFQRQLPPHLEGLYRPRNYLRQLQPQAQQQQNQQAQFRPEESLPRYGQQNQQLPIGQGAQNLQQLQDQQRLQGFAQQMQPKQSFLEQQQPSEGFPFSPSSFFPPQRQPQFNDYDRPLTVRDFERLLQLLVFRQQQQPFNINPYYPSSNPLAYPPFVPNYNQPFSQIPRPPFYSNPLSTGLYDPAYQNPYYSPSMPIGDMAQFPQPNQNQQQQQNLMAQKDERFSRRRQYNSRFFSPQQSQQIPQQQQTQLPSPLAGPSENEFNYNSLQGPVDNNYLPPSVREQLLYRMLVLALRPDGMQSPQFAPHHQQPNLPQQLAPSASSSLHTVLEPEQQETSAVIKTSTDYSSSKKPVRSVQILGEEEEE